jgi:hypothetical protein
MRSRRAARGNARPLNCTLSAMSQMYPDGWAQSYEDIIAFGRTPSHEEIEWALAYERDQLRPWARFPRDGDVYEAVEDCRVRYLTHWRAPFSGGGEGTIRRRTQVRVEVAKHETEPVYVRALALDAEELERELISEEERNDSRFDGITLTIRTHVLNVNFRLVHSRHVPSA